MIDGQRVLALIPARGGSKRLPGKNVRPFRGRPLIAWSIEAALAAAAVDRLVVSTDDDAIVAAALAAGAEVPFRRPPALAGDGAGSVDVALHALDALGDPARILLLLQPTSPLRQAQDIDAALRRLADGAAPAVIGVTTPFKPLGYHVRLGAGDKVTPVEVEGGDEIRLINGALYAIRVDVLRQARDFAPPGTVAFEMPFERSIDIDTALDWQLAEALAP
ncbi:acylneuraminate cytidylyltransferase family protein [Oleomonas cavernae]|uniref:Acylneuraminate cytidylyltransferase family protein n=1 Tax=Oleomonas cavernae TaxID=2320859 RepID=A0A418WIP8_9PROT|nr:acylneuraminate cytidylyltransferase family protein [Oleomonas cavernae]RJF89921.1 acylneuraminate cytidylyltransferase family protein [Oleomonas cavernae]